MHLFLFSREMDKEDVAVHKKCLQRNNDAIFGWLVGNFFGICLVCRWFVVGLWVVWLVCGWFRVLQLTLKKDQFIQKPFSKEGNSTSKDLILTTIFSKQKV